MLMIKLLRKDIKWLWGLKQAKLFKALKRAFILVLVLAYYNYMKKTIVKTDALNWASGRVLF